MGAARIRRPAVVVAGLASAAAALVACSSSTAGSGSTAGRYAPAAAGTSTPAGTPDPASASVRPRAHRAAPTTETPRPAAAPVHIQLKFSDGQTFGVGIPVIAFFSARITNATALQNATAVRINGRQVSGGRWYFEPVGGHPGYPIEGDYRLRHPWPAHARIFVSIPAKGLAAGGGRAYDNSLTLRFATGASHVALVDNSTHRLTLYTDGQVAGRYPISLGARSTPTARGIKVIMEKGRSICMSGRGYHDCGVEYTQRLTYGGEYLHSAPWNCIHAPGCVGPYDHIGSGNSSNGCTNLRPDDAAALYRILRIGDIVRYPNADGPAMTMGAGYGDWNVPWRQWRTGGAVGKI